MTVSATRATTAQEVHRFQTPLTARLAMFAKSVDSANMARNSSRCVHLAHLIRILKQKHNRIALHVHLVVIAREIVLVVKQVFAKQATIVLTNQL